MPLHSVFFFEGFSDQTRVRPFEPGIEDLPRVRSLADDVTDGWGMQPGRRLMKFLTVVDVLSTARCHLVEVGPPGDVAETIEGLVREAC